MQQDITALRAALLITSLFAAPATAQTEAELSCYRLAGSDIDGGLPPGVPGVAFESIGADAKAACDDALAEAIATGTLSPRVAFTAGRAFAANGDAETALQLYRILEGEAFPLTLMNLAYHYSEGSGVETDMSRAAEYMKRAAEGGLPSAWTALKDWLDTGRLDDPDGTFGAAVLRGLAPHDDDIRFDLISAIESGTIAPASETELADLLAAAYAAGDPIGGRNYVFWLEERGETDEALIAAYNTYLWAGNADPARDAGWPGHERESALLTVRLADTYGGDSLPDGEVERLRAEYGDVYHSVDTTANCTTGPIDATYFAWDQNRPTSSVADQAEWYAARNCPMEPELLAELEGLHDRAEDLDVSFYETVVAWSNGDPLPEPDYDEAALLEERTYDLTPRGTGASSEITLRVTCDGDAFYRTLRAWEGESLSGPVKSWGVLHDRVRELLLDNTPCYDSGTGSLYYPDMLRLQEIGLEIGDPYTALEIHAAMEGNYTFRTAPVFPYLAECEASLSAQRPTAAADVSRQDAALAGLTRMRAGLATTSSIYRTLDFPVRERLAEFGLAAAPVLARCAEGSDPLTALSGDWPSIASGFATEVAIADAAVNRTDRSDRTFGNWQVADLGWGAFAYTRSPDTAYTFGYLCEVWGDGDSTGRDNVFYFDSPVDLDDSSVSVDFGNGRSAVMDVDSPEPLLLSPAIEAAYFYLESETAVDDVKRARQLVVRSADLPGGQVILSASGSRAAVDWAGSLCNGIRDRY
ncbi:sel1 repeat family protein [Pelagovum pacificum]|uniref:Sel1 repeat family protein n=1 Tax=Pelagovum pacificum TaxID=2588711 RepID=A0A5C5GIP4_9RHOB|nr:sel1 repeat family protein [Pelagovum pacificum]QQA43088.1 sel1 repeat family protein [Pelagovum pacificum]TNY33769.1 sel1 repeat family protein [Pelagovum pacificum]